MSYMVGLEQRKPFEWVTIERFAEIRDARDFTERYAAGRGYINLSRNRWRSPDDDDQFLVIARAFD